MGLIQALANQIMNSLQNQEISIGSISGACRSRYTGGV